MLNLDQNSDERVNCIRFVSRFTNYCIHGVLAVKTQSIVQSGVVEINALKACCVFQATNKGECETLWTTNWKIKSQQSWSVV